MNYQEMSDRSIDLEVFQTIFGKDVFTKDADLRRAWERGISYCNSWADAGPIIQDNKISIIHDCMAEPQDGGCWLARPTYGYEHEKARSDNPLRAAMVLFLMMKGGE